MSDEPTPLEPLPRGSDSDSLDQHCRREASELRGLGGLTSLFNNQTPEDNHYYRKLWFEQLKIIGEATKKMREAGCILRNKQELAWQNERRAQVAREQAMYGNF